MPRPWIDISAPLHPGLPHWPGDPPLELTQLADLRRGDPATVSALRCSLHTGTHIDAPRHYLPRGATMDAWTPDLTNGPARVLSITNPRAITPADLRPHRPRRGERLLLRTRNSPAAWRSRRFAKDFVALTPDAAAYLADRRLRLLGVDYLSVGPYRDEAAGTAVHRTLLSAGIWILEGLNLTPAPPGRYHLLCLPLRLPNLEAAPARALLRPRD